MEFVDHFKRFRTSIWSLRSASMYSFQFLVRRLFFRLFSYRLFSLANFSSSAFLVALFVLIIFSTCLIVSVVAPRPCPSFSLFTSHIPVGGHFRYLHLWRFIQPDHHRDQRTDIECITTVKTTTTVKIYSAWPAAWRFIRSPAPPPRNARSKKLRSEKCVDVTNKVYRVMSEGVPQHRWLRSSSSLRSSDAPVFLFSRAKCFRARPPSDARGSSFAFSFGAAPGENFHLMNAPWLRARRLAGASSCTLTACSAH